MATNTTTTLRLPAALVLTAALSLGACGDDDADADATDAAPAREVAAETTRADGDLRRMCDAYIGITQAFNEEAPDLAAIEQMVDELDGSAPAEIVEPINVMVAGVRDGLAGDDAFFEEDAFVAAAAEADPYVLEHCELDAVVDVTAVDFGYEGIPAEVPAGTVGIAMENASESEMHELLVLRKNDGVSESFEELLELPEQEAESKTTFVGHVFAPPTGQGTSFVDLAPGDYLAVCFIPQGATETMEAAGEPPSGPPHFVLGMQQEFTVG